MEPEVTDFPEQDTDSCFKHRMSLPFKSICLEEHEQSKTRTKEFILQKAKELCVCTPKMAAQSLLKLFPVLIWLPRYKIKEQLLGDIVSGIIVGIVAIPQSIAYSLLANQDPIYGLYTNFFCCLTYVIFATSRHNCVGTYGVLCLMVGETVSKHLKAAGYTSPGGNATVLLINSSLVANGTAVCDKSCYAIKVATSLTFLVGVYQAAMCHKRARPFIGTSNKNWEGATSQSLMWSITEISSTLKRKANRGVSRKSILERGHVVGRSLEILFSIFRLSFIAVYLSEPLLSGFVTGSSLTILTSQVKYLFGLSIPSHNGPGSLILTWIDVFVYIRKTNLCDLITSIVALAAIVPIKEINDRFKKQMKVPFPIEFVVIVVATVVSHYFNFKGKYKSSICGKIPTGFLPPNTPDLSLIPSLAADAFPISVIGFAITVSLAEMFGKKHGYPVRANQEMLAIGMCNLIPSFFYSFTCSAALAKTLLRESTGAKTQITGVVTSSVLLLVLLVIAPLFYSLQNCILGVITIANLRGALRKFQDTPNMWRINKIDTVIWWVSMLASALITTELGLLVAVCFSIICVICRTQRPRATLMAKVSDTEIYEDKFTYKQLSDIPNVKIFRFDASLYYANKDYFKSMLYEKSEVNPLLVAALQRKMRRAHEAATISADSGRSSRFALPKLTRKHRKSVIISMPQIGMHSLIIDCAAMQFIDTVGLSVLKETYSEYDNIGVHVFLANCNPSVRHSLLKGGYFSHSVDSHKPEQLAFHSVHEAVQFAERKYREKQRETQQMNAAFSLNPSQVIPEDTEEQTKL